MSLVSWELAQATLRAYKCKPVPNSANQYGCWWQNEWGGSFFVQQIGDARDVDDEMLGNILRGILTLRSVRNQRG